MFSGAQTGASDDPYNGINEVVGPGTWTLGPHAFGNSSITEASNADLRVAIIGGREIVSVWQSGLSALMQVGTDPSTQPQSIQPNGQLVTAPAVAVDQASNIAVVAYKDANSGKDFFRQILPNMMDPVAMPQGAVDSPGIVARTGGGLYSAYPVGFTKVLLLRFSGQSRVMPVPKGTQVLAAGAAAGPDGRLWVFYGNGTKTYVTRTNKTVSRFEPVQAFKSLPAAQYFRLEGEGSAGPLDLFSNLTVDGKLKDGTYYTRVLPALSLAVAEKTVKGNVEVTARVTDAGDPVAGAKVKGLPGGPKTTNAKGMVVFTVNAAKTHGSLKATKPGYVPAKAQL